MSKSLHKSGNHTLEAVSFERVILYFNSLSDRLTVSMISSVKCKLVQALLKNFSKLDYKK